MSGQDVKSAGGIERTRTGLYCPGCGSTRALYALLHGRPGEALAMNPLLLVVLAWFAQGLLL